MELITIRELYKNSDSYMDQKVTIGGWVRSIRGSKAFGFIVVNDGTFFEPLQVVYHDKMDNFAEISKMNVGAAIIVSSNRYRYTGSNTSGKAAIRDPGRYCRSRRSIRTGLPTSEETSQL